MTGLLVDLLSNSSIQHHNNCMTESKENYWQDPGDEKVKQLAIAVQAK